MVVNLDSIRRTEPSKSLGIIRIMLGIMFIMTGVMKYSVPMLWNAWSGQLRAGGIPFYELNLYLIPVIEIIVGTLLILGFYSRMGSLVTILMMIVATYVHIVADDPNLFPLQPHLPIIPIATIAMGAYILKGGGGSWSKDLSSGIDQAG